MSGATPSSAGPSSASLARHDSAEPTSSGADAELRFISYKPDSTRKRSLRKAKNTVDNRGFATFDNTHFNTANPAVLRVRREPALGEDTSLPASSSTTEDVMEGLLAGAPIAPVNPVVHPRYEESLPGLSIGDELPPGDISSHIQSQHSSAPFGNPASPRPCPQPSQLQIPTLTFSGNMDRQSDPALLYMTTVTSPYTPATDASQTPLLEFSPLSPFGMAPPTSPYSPFLTSPVFPHALEPVSIANARSLDLQTQASQVESGHGALRICYAQGLSRLESEALPCGCKRIKDVSHAVVGVERSPQCENAELAGDYFYGGPTHAEASDTANAYHVPINSQRW